jgi:ApaG protein
MKQVSKFTRSSEEQLLDGSRAFSAKSYMATTNEIQVTVLPEFVDSKSSIIGDLFIWAYHVRIDNRSDKAVKLVSRYWRIIDEQGVVQEVHGEGVIGEQPIIKAGGSYQYSSGVHLRYPSGIMTGQYQVQQVQSDSGDETFSVKIPTFSLDVPGMKEVIN